MILIKLGGSVITDKSKEYTFKPRVVKRLLDEIKEGTKNERFVIVHGGGSFGHPGAHRYGFNTKAPGQLAQGTAEVQYQMRILNNLVLDMMIKADLWGVSIPGGLISIFDEGKLKEIKTDILNELLNLGTIPVAFGDVAIDKTWSVTICSGDDLMLGMAHLAKKAIFVTDVDGIYKEGKVCELFTEDMLPLNSDDIPSSHDRIDVTGGMKDKTNKMLDIASHCPSFIVNGTVEGRLKKLLQEDTTVCTEVRA